MDKIDFKQLIDELLTNKRIANRVSELKLSEDQIIEALPILLDMNEQQEWTEMFQPIDGSYPQALIVDVNKSRNDGEV